jgi:RyR domain
MSSDDAEAKIREGCTKFDLRPDELTEMAGLEHQAWLTHYRRDGWRLGPRDDARKVHPSLLPWDQLPEDARTKTRAGVIETLFQLRALGYRSVRSTGSPQRYLRTGTVRATRLAEPLEWSTRSGDRLRGERGDWLVVDESGGRRTVRADAFPRTHEHESGDTWRRTAEVLARPGLLGEAVTTSEGPVRVTDGDWVVQDLDGRTWVVPAAHFDASYRLASLPEQGRTDTA